MKKFAYIMFLVGMAFATISCDRNKGPAEKAGEKVDQVIEDTSDSVKEAIEDASDKVEEAAEEVKDEVDDATDDN